METVDINRITPPGRTALEAFWNVVHSDLRIASTNIVGFETLASHTCNLFGPERVPYSGIVESTQEHLATGDVIEKNCYQNGGLQFLYKSYETVTPGSFFPVGLAVSAITRIATSYLRNVHYDERGTAALDVAWAVCQRESDYGTLHNHIPPSRGGGRRFSGMFYLSTPTCINPRTFPNGCLHLVADNTVYYFPPIPGAVVIWPAWILHGIHPFRGSGDRVGIAFDFVSN